MDETRDIESFLVEEDGVSRDTNGEFVLPEILPILPLRNVVAYPGTVTPLAIGRDRSRQLIAEAKPNQTLIGLVAQKSADVDQPGFNDVYSVGTAAMILKTIKMPQGPVHVVVHALGRFKIIQFVANRPYLKAKVAPLQVTFRMTKKLQALMVSIRRTANRVIELSPNVPEEASVMLENIEHPSALADFLAADLEQVDFLIHATLESQIALTNEIGRVVPIHHVKIENRTSEVLAVHTAVDGIEVEVPGHGFMSPGTRGVAS